MGLSRFIPITLFRKYYNKTRNLSKTELEQWSNSFWTLDGQLAIQRSQVMGNILYSMSSESKNYIDINIKGKSMINWPSVEMPDFRSITNNNNIKTAILTYAGDLLSWYLGNITTDTYFCPERFQTMFGSFYVKDAPAVGNINYTISSNLTANSGISFNNVLNTVQQNLMANITTINIIMLKKIVELRKKISTELRNSISNSTLNITNILFWSQRIGILDADINYNSIKVIKNLALTTTQLQSIKTMRQNILGDLAYPENPFLFATKIN